MEIVERKSFKAWSNVTNVRDENKYLKQLNYSEKKQANVWFKIDWEKSHQKFRTVRLKKSTVKTTKLDWKPTTTKNKQKNNNQLTWWTF